MTEAASQIASNPLPPSVRKIGSVGIAAGPELAIMDGRGALVQEGITGEIAIRGPNVIQGYEDPEANRNAFAHQWLKTGDLGFLDSDGYLYITGRLKEIINRGGEKISPQEVEVILRQHPNVAQAVAFPVPDVRLGEDVAAAIVLRHRFETTASNLRQFVSTRLAVWKIPRRIMIVERIPSGSNGKLQRLRLAEFFGLSASANTHPSLPIDRTPPHTPVEAILTELWKQVLDVGDVGVHDDFFALGGDSILATQLIVRVRDVMHEEISFLSFFENPTVSQMAKHIQDRARPALERRIPPLQPVARLSALPLSYSQKRLWFLDQMGLARHAYTLLDAMRLHGLLDQEALDQSLQEIMRRHEILRTVFIDVAGQPRQVIQPFVSLPLSIVDLRVLPEEARELQIRAFAQAEAQRCFDLTQGPLLRITLVQLTKEEHVLFLSMHHIVSDSWSYGIFWHELTLLYTAFSAGNPSPLSSLSVQYGDFAAWQQTWLQGDALFPDLVYWKRQLADLITLQLPTDRPRPTIKTFQGARHAVRFSSRLTQKLRALSVDHGVTLFMTVLAAFQTLLHRYSGQDDIAVGSLIANRNQVATEGLIGFFVNTITLRTDCSGDPSFQTLLARVREAMLGAYHHQNLPFESLLEALQPPRDLSCTPLFQVLFVLHNIQGPRPALADLHISPLEVDPGTARFDLSLDLHETATGLEGWFEYSTDVFDAATIARMSDHLKVMLDGIVANPALCLSHLPLLQADERRRLLVDWNQTQLDYPYDLCIHEVFEAQASRTPDAIAVICGDTFLSYHDLNCRANQVGHALQAIGVGAGMLVGLCMERSAQMMIGLLGILKSGAAYVPLDPSYPEERLAFMLQDAQLSVVLTQADLKSRFINDGIAVICLDSEWPMIAQYGCDNLPSETTPDQVAYLLYTSGSTGNPKGVLGVHRAVINALAWMWQAYPFASDDVCCQKTSISFGDSIQELFGPLLRGVSTVFVPQGVLIDLPRFVQTLAAYGVTRVILVPSLLRAMLDAFDNLEALLPKLRLWFAGGEMLPSDLSQRFRAYLPQSRLINLYGVSEVSDDVTAYDTGRAHPSRFRIPIGNPIANLQTYVLDRYLQPMPIGAPGELYIGGDGLTYGYLNHSGLTAQQFLPHPFSSAPGTRFYKTGDLACYLPDGTLDFLGRLDHQVKLRGIRIELGEIEAALNKHPAIQEAVVNMSGDIVGEERLVAYLIPTQEPAPTVSALRRFLQTRLPASMIPAAFVSLRDLPRTPSGKIDRRKLPASHLSRSGVEAPFIAPRTPSERRMMTLWSDFLAVETIGVHDNFFELGGHSLLAIQLLSRIRKELGIEMSLVQFFENPTVASLSEHIETARRAPQARQMPTLTPLARERPLPASADQERMWTVAQMLPRLPLFNMTQVISLIGALEVKILEQCFHEIIQRHEILRTTFTMLDRQLVQVIAPATGVRITVRDLSSMPSDHQEEMIRQIARREAQRLFDLQRGPLLYVCLLRLDRQEHALIVIMHHIISDGWSMGILMRELSVLYDAFISGTPSPLPTLSIQYADFVHWQRRWRQWQMMHTQLDYWQQQLLPPPPILQLPTDRPREQTISLQSARQYFHYSQDLCEGLKYLSSQEQSTLFMTLFTAFSALFYTFTNQEDLCISTLVANRNIPETEKLIGLFANLVLLRIDLSNNPSLLELLERVRKTTVTAYDNQNLLLEDLIQTLERQHAIERQSLCQVMFILQNWMSYSEQYDSHNLKFAEFDQGPIMPELDLTTLDIIVVMRERPYGRGLSGICIYKSALFETMTIKRLLKNFEAVLNHFIRQPEQSLSSLSALLEP